MSKAKAESPDLWLSPYVFFGSPAFAIPRNRLQVELKRKTVASFRPRIFSSADLERKTEMSMFLGEEMSRSVPVGSVRLKTSGHTLLP